MQRRVSNADFDNGGAMWQGTVGSPWELRAMPPAEVGTSDLQPQGTIFCQQPE